MSDIHSSKRYFYVPQTDEGKLIRKSQLELKKSTADNESFKKTLDNYKNYSTKSISENYYNNVSETIFKSIKDSIDKTVLNQNKIISKKYGVKLSENDLQLINNSYNPNNKFKDSNIINRLRKLENQNRFQTNIIKQDKNLTENQKVNALKNYYSGNKFGLNAWRPTAKILISEQSRGNQEAVKSMARYLESQGYIIKLIWILSTLPNRKYDICDKHAEVREYNIETIPEYPHPQCFCRLEIKIVGKSPTLEEMQKYEDLVYKTEGWDSVNSILESVENFTYKVKLAVNKINNVVDWSNNALELLNDPTSIDNYYNLARSTLRTISDYSEVLSQIEGIVSNIEAAISDLVKLPAEIEEVYNSLKDILFGNIDIDDIDKINKTMNSFKKVLRKKGINKSNQTMLENKYSSIIESINTFKTYLNEDTLFMQ